MKIRYIYWPSADCMVDVLVTEELGGTMIDIDPFREYCIPEKERKLLEKKARNQENSRGR